MRALSAWPMGTALNCDFVDRMRSTVAPGEQCIDLQVDLEDLPGWGLLCIHEETVRSMVAALGWKLDESDDDDDDGLLPVLAANVALHEENQRLREALALVVGEPTDIERVMAS